MLIQYFIKALPLNRQNTDLNNILLMSVEPSCQHHQQYRPRSSFHFYHLKCLVFTTAELGIIGEIAIRVDSNL